MFPEVFSALMEKSGSGFGMCGPVGKLGGISFFGSL